MSFEIKKYEGAGRLGNINLGRTYETPTVINLYIKREAVPDPIETTLKTYSSSSRLDSILETTRVQDSKSSSRPSCFLYPSLQMQGKSISNLTQILEFFPEKHRSLILKNDNFHLIPWDLPEVYLNGGINYFKHINNLMSQLGGNFTNFILNVPFRSIQSESWKELSNLTVGVVSLGDISSLLNHPKFLLSYLSSVKEKIAPNVMLYAPGVPSSFIPILTYLGIDLFDLSFLSVVNTSDIVLELENQIVDYMNLINRTKVAFRAGKLRDLVRVYSNSYPPQKTLLRMIDIQVSLDKGTSIYGSKTLYCTDQTDFSRPEVNRFRARVKERYLTGSHIQAILFLPCSAKKPYSQSKSHQIFQRSIRRSLKSKRHAVAEVILTSPLGVVPRELEYTYPAAHYDIPVTGDWSELERHQLAEDVKCFLEKAPHATQLVGYVKDTEKEVLAKVCKELKRDIYLIDEEVTSLISKEGLYQLRQLLQEKLSIKPISKRNKIQDFLRAVADYQFGRGIGELLIPDGVRLLGHKELGIRVQYSEKHLATFRASTGTMTLSIEAAKRMIDAAKNIVVFDGDEIRGTTIFANAIKKASDEIRINDEVIVMNSNNELIATGIAYLPGDLLVQMPRGLGIKIRQKV